MNSKATSNASRRCFRKGTALTAASAFAIPTIIFCSVLNSQASPGANNQIVIGESEFDKYGGCTAIKGNPTGFFHLEEIDGRHFLITPDGHGCRVLGINHFHNIM